VKEKGLVIINTGNGKGKTTAAFGQALRAAGHGAPVCIVQFIKGKWQTGESKALESCGLDIELHVCGTGFTWEAEDMAEVKSAALKGWELAREKISSGRYGLVVLDELTYLVNYGVIRGTEVLAVLGDRPTGVDVVITGRDAPEELIEVADLVTEMREVKHPYAAGVKARKGVEF
jgi:cob(I)alamin adenosyltransferase